MLLSSYQSLQVNRRRSNFLYQQHGQLDTLPFLRKLYRLFVFKKHSSRKKNTFLFFLFLAQCGIYRVGQKTEPQTHDHNCQILTDLKNHWKIPW